VISHIPEPHTPIEQPLIARESLVPKERIASTSPSLKPQAIT